MLSCGPTTVTKALTPNSFGGSGGAATLPMRWNIDFTIEANRLDLKIHDEFDGDEEAAIINMMDLWDTAVSPQMKFFIDTKTVSTADLPAAVASLGPGGSPNEFGIYKSTDWFSELSSGALAVTQYFGTTGTINGQQYQIIAHADIIMNMKGNLPYSLNDTTDTYNFSSVVLHEVGHLIGLLHNNTTISVMYPYLGMASLKDTLTALDRSNIRANYSDLLGLQAEMNPVILGAQHEGERIPDGTPIHGLIYQMPDGQCQHYVNGELISTHHHSRFP
jgi:hypothetical protein